MKKKNLLQRTILITIVTLAGLYLVIGPRHRPKPSDFSWSGIKRNLGSNIKLGLDLKGGSHLVMRVKVEDYLKWITQNNATTAETVAKEAGFEIKQGRADIGGGNYRVVLEPADMSKAPQIKEAVEKKLELGDSSMWSYNTLGSQMSWSLTSAAQRLLAQNATQQALNIIDGRINSFGVAEPTLQTHGAENSHQILLQMPGVQDPERVKRLLVLESRLELVHIISPPSPMPSQTYASEEEAKMSLNTGGVVPANRRVLPYKERMEKTPTGEKQAEQKPQRWVVVEAPAIIDGSQVRNASATPTRAGGTEDYEIQFSLKKDGADKFGQWTGANINQYMGVVLNDKVESIAFIKSQIFDSGMIEGNYDKQQAEDLALVLRSGALPAAIEYLEERTVGPSLGADSIRAGVRASLVGLGLVVLFMLIYYRGSGINAVVALILNMILMLAGLIVFGATLTLPGIAGIILTIGMAVDSNVLIFERIREELLTGKTIPSAVDHGFDRAFITIIDTHVTTIVSALFLFVFGTGPIRGFAVSLVIGLVVNLFSAVYVSRTIFMWLLSRKEKVQTLSI
jgi:preprotein translocase subunit SecD